MTNTTTKPDFAQPVSEMVVDLDNWFDPIEIEVREISRVTSDDHTASPSCFGTLLAAYYPDGANS